MEHFLTFASETLIIIAFLLGYKLGKTGETPTLKDLKETFQPTKTKIFGKEKPDNDK